MLALSVRRNGSSAAHSLYWRQFSFTAKSYASTSAGTCSRSFFSPTASPRACASAAVHRL